MSKWVIKRVDTYTDFYTGVRYSFQNEDYGEYGKLNDAKVFSSKKRAENTRAILEAKTANGYHLEVIQDNEGATHADNE